MTLWSSGSIVTSSWSTCCCVFYGFLAAFVAVIDWLTRHDSRLFCYLHDWLFVFDFFVNNKKIVYTFTSLHSILHSTHFNLIPKKRFYWKMIFDKKYIEQWSRKGTKKFQKNAQNYKSSSWYFLLHYIRLPLWGVWKWTTSNITLLGKLPLNAMNNDIN